MGSEAQRTEKDRAPDLDELHGLTGRIENALNRLETTEDAAKGYFWGESRGDLAKEACPPAPGIVNRLKTDLGEAADFFDARLNSLEDLFRRLGVPI